VSAYGEREREARVARAKARLTAAELRVKAVGQDNLAAGYARQAGKPIYDGQDVVCAGKAAEAAAFAARTRAEADLLEAEAGI
jgi:uncharacterized protein YbjT (DUF2867 family)